VFEKKHYSVKELQLDTEVTLKSDDDLIKFWSVLINLCKKREGDNTFTTWSENLSLEQTGLLIQLIHYSGLDIVGWQNMEEFMEEEADTKKSTKTVRDTIKMTGVDFGFELSKYLEVFSYHIMRQPMNIGSWVYQLYIACNTIFFVGDLDRLKSISSVPIEDEDDFLSMLSQRREGQKSIINMRRNIETPQGLSSEMALLYLSMIEPLSRDVLYRLISLPGPSIVGHGSMSYTLQYFLIGFAGEWAPKLVDLLLTYRPVMKG
jgi:hypothetical protein